MTTTTVPSTFKTRVKEPIHLLALPSELRHQIWTYAFGNLSLYPFPPSTYHSKECQRCHSASPSATITTTTSSTTHDSGSDDTQSSSSSAPRQNLYKPYFRALLTNKQIHTEASPIFHSTLTLQIKDTFTLDHIRKFSPLSIRKHIAHLELTTHLTDDTRYAWHSSLRYLSPATFPNLNTITIKNHMRSPTSYDRLVDAIYLAAPLVSTSPTSSCLPAHLRFPSPNLTLDFSYARDEIMFESPFLGEITTADSLAAHESVVRDLMADEGFVWASGNEDFEFMTGRLLSVARSHEERWLEDLQRRRLGGLTVREVQERVLRSAGVGVGGGDQDSDDDGDVEGGGEQEGEASVSASANGNGNGDENGGVWDEDRREAEVQRLMNENGWTREQYEMVIAMTLEGGGIHDYDE